MKGLASNFQLRNGRFFLSSGVEKTRDEVNFYCQFDKRRTYLSDYGKNSVSLLHSIVQKPTSYVLGNKTLITGTLQKEIQKYVPSARVNSVDIGYFPENRQQYVVKIEYSAIQDDKSEVQDVTFI